MTLHPVMVTAKSYSYGKSLVGSEIRVFSASKSSPPHLRRRSADCSTCISFSYYYTWPNHKQQHKYLISIASSVLFKEKSSRKFSNIWTIPLVRWLSNKIWTWKRKPYVVYWIIKLQRMDSLFQPRVSKLICLHISPTVSLTSLFQSIL